MPNQQHLAILNTLHKMIFSLDKNFFTVNASISIEGTLGNVAVPRLFRDRTNNTPSLKGFDFSIAGKSGKVLSFRFIEQNPNTSSQYARMANLGAKIAWLIDTKVDNGFLGRYQSSPESGNIGHWYPNRPWATRPKTQAVASRTEAVMTQTDSAELPELPEDIPEVSTSEVSIPEMVIEMIGNIDEEPLEPEDVNGHEY